MAKNTPREFKKYDYKPTKEELLDYSLCKLLQNTAAVTLTQAYQILPEIKRVLLMYSKEAYEEGKKFSYSTGLFEEKTLPKSFDEWRKDKGL